VGVGQVQIPQHEVDGNHGQYAGEQVDDDREILQQAAALESAAAECVGNHQHKAGRDHAVEHGHNKGIGKPLRELCHTVRMEQHVDVIVQGITFRKKSGDVDTAIAGEGSDQQPDD